MVDIVKLYGRYGPMVYRQCYRILRNEENALDAMQDVFVKVIRRQEILTEKAPSSLLYTIATNTSLNHLRTQKRRTETQDEKLLMQIAAADDHTERAEAALFTDKIFETENESTRTIAVLHYVEGMTLAETAEKVGMSVSGIRKRLRQLRKKVEILREV